MRTNILEMTTGKLFLINRTIEDHGGALLILTLVRKPFLGVKMTILGFEIEICL